MGRPASKFVKQLSKADQQYLQQVWREHKVYTVRCRAHAILLSSEGTTVSQMQEIFGISKPTALSWIDRWENHGRDGLEDKPRPGGPPSLNEEEQETLRELLHDFPRQPKKVIQALKRKTGKLISRTTLRRLARKFGLRWKRYRRSKPKSPDRPRKLRLAREEIEELRSMTDLDLAYFDESAFSLQGVVPYGWQPIGERNEVPLGTERGNVQVLGIQEEDGEVVAYLHKGSVSGATVADVLDDYSHRITRDTVLILDPASVHTCRLIEEHLDTWATRGLFLYILPSQTQELNKIEHLWDKLKYQELPVHAWQCLSSLIDSLIDAFCDKGEAMLMPSLQN